MYYGDLNLGDTIDIKFCTVNTSGQPTTLSGSPVLVAYPSASTTEILTGITLTVDFDGITGLNNVRVVATSGNGYLVETNYALVLSAGTVSGTIVTGYEVASFSIENRANAEASIADAVWDEPNDAHLIADTTGHRLALAESLVFSAVLTLGTAGDGLTDLPDQTMNITGNLTGNVTGSVGSIGTGGIASTSFAAGAIDAAAIAANAIGASEIADGAIDAGTFAADAITAAKIADGAIDANTFAAGAINAAAIAADAIGASELAADAVAEIADGVWDEITSGHTTAGSYGDKFGAHLPAVLKGLTTSGGTTTAVPLNTSTGIDGATPSAVDDFYNGRVIIFTSGALAGQATSISDYVGSTKVLTVVATTSAVTSGVTLVIV